MKNLLTWLITSSADPRNTSLAVKGFLTSLVPIAMVFMGIDGDTASSIVSAIEQVVFYGFSLVSAVMAMIGLMRKLHLGRWSAHE